MTATTRRSPGPEAAAEVASDLLRKRLLESRHFHREHAAIDPEQIVQAAIAYVDAAVHPAADVVGPVYDTAGVLQATGLSGAQLDGRRRRATVIAARTADGSWVYPVAQFTTTGVDSRVRDVLQIFKGDSADPWTRLTWWTAPAAELDQSSPLAWLVQGRPPGPAVAMAREAAARWSAG